MATIEAEKHTQVRHAGTRHARLVGMCGCDVLAQYLWVFFFVVVVRTGLVAFKLCRSHFYLSALSTWSLPLCGRGVFYVLRRHIAGELGQTPDE